MNWHTCINITLIQKKTNEEDQLLKESNDNLRVYRNTENAGKNEILDISNFRSDAFEFEISKFHRLHRAWNDVWVYYNDVNCDE